MRSSLPRAGPGCAGTMPGQKSAGATLKERKSPRRWCTPQEARPSGILPPRSSPVHTIRNDFTPPWGTGRPTRSRRSTEQQDEQPERPLSGLSETRPAVHRRMLSQLFFDHVYLVPDQDTDQLTTTATCLPPFDSILRWRVTADVESTEGAVVERRKSEGVEGTEGVRGSALDEPANLGKSQGETKVTDDEGSAEGMGRARPGPTPTADEVERDDEVGTTDLIAPQAAHITARSARLDGSELAETSQNTPVSIQKPTSWDDHDVGLSAMQLVGVAGFEPTTSSSRTKRATKLRHTPCAAGDSIVGPW